jgi:hypothetical protein
MGDFLLFFVLYSTLFHLPPLIFYCVGGCRGIEPRIEFSNIISILQRPSSLMSRMREGVVMRIFSHLSKTPVPDIELLLVSFCPTLKGSVSRDGFG